MQIIAFYNCFTFILYNNCVCVCKTYLVYLNMDFIGNFLLLLNNFIQKKIMFYLIKIELKLLLL